MMFQGLLWSKTVVLLLPIQFIRKNHLRKIRRKNIPLFISWSPLCLYPLTKKINIKFMISDSKNKKLGKKTRKEKG